MATRNSWGILRPILPAKSVWSQLVSAQGYNYLQFMERVQQRLSSWWIMTRWITIGVHGDRSMSLGIYQQSAKSRCQWNPIKGQNTTILDAINLLFPNHGSCQICLWLLFHKSWVSWYFGYFRVRIIRIVLHISRTKREQKSNGQQRDRDGEDVTSVKLFPF